MAVSGNLTAGISVSEKITPTTIESIASRAIKAGQTSITLDDGTSDFQCKFIWSDRLALAATTKTYDLTALPVPNVAGYGTGSPIITLAKVKAIYLINESITDGQILYFGNAGSNIWSACFDTSTNRELIMPGSPMLKSNLMAQGSNPWTVDATHKNIKIDSGANTITYTIVILGS